MDILIFAVIAAFLVYRLNAVLGTRNGAERQRPNPFSPSEPRPVRAPVQQMPSAAPARPSLQPQSFDQLVDMSANTDGKIDGIFGAGPASP